MTLLQSYPWPGNVRELENVMQRAIILAPGKTVRAEDLSFNIKEGVVDISDIGNVVDISDISNVVDIGDYHPAGSFELQLRDFKVNLAVSAVRENNGNKTLAARSLCISRAYLHRLIRLAEPVTVSARTPLRISSNVFIGNPPGLPAVLTINGVTEPMSTALATRLVPWRPI
jgi:DNA-binding NtrC family response regulator